MRFPIPSLLIIMETAVFQNILFLVLSIFIAFITVGFVFLVVYTILILKSIYHLFEAIKREGEKIASDIELVKEKVKSSGAMFTSIIVYLVSLLKKHNKKK